MGVGELGSTIRAGMARLAWPLVRGARNAHLVADDLRAWRRWRHEPADEADAVTFGRLFGRLPEFRALVIHRLRHGSSRDLLAAVVLARAFPPERTLHLVSPDIGGGFYIQHGYATIVDAERIGRDVFIGHGITIGNDERQGRPVIEDGVIVYADAMVIGAVTVGSGAKVGAKSLVNRDVEAGAVVAGIPARPLARVSARGEA